MTHLTIRIIFILFIFTLASSNAQTLPDSNLVLITGGTFTMGETMLEYEGPPELYAAVEHSVTLSNFRMSKTEITNQQYVDFLNAAYTDGLVTVAVETDPGPDNGATLVFGT
ncbi:MAG: SUMF1/EgtB/PvdO family nonheme iron enzyme, partial [Melioribacteraceae bacterium]|nr:SUMF1/EgtB/PvdO family nonheme iron enzyme [Melioribacteraceae bacterium]